MITKKELALNLKLKKEIHNLVESRTIRGLACEDGVEIVKTRQNLITLTHNKTKRKDIWFMWVKQSERKDLEAEAEYTANNTADDTADDRTDDVKCGGISDVCVLNISILTSFVIVKKCLFWGLNDTMNPRERLWVSDSHSVTFSRGTDDQISFTQFSNRIKSWWRLVDTGLIRVPCDWTLCTGYRSMGGGIPMMAWCGWLVVCGGSYTLGTDLWEEAYPWRHGVGGW